MSLKFNFKNIFIAAFLMNNILISLIEMEATTKIIIISTCVVNDSQGRNEAPALFPGRKENKSLDHH